MKRTFEYDFYVWRRAGIPGWWRQKSVTLRKTVTDRMEARDFFKAEYAANHFNRELREKYGYKNSVVTAAEIREIK